MDKGVSVVSPWTPVTPAKPVLSRAGKVAATELPLIDLNVGLESSEEFPPGFEPNVLLDESGDFPPGFEPKILFDESEEFPPGFEPMVLSAGSDSSCGVFCSVLEPTRRKDCNLEASATSQGEGYGFIPAQPVSPFAGFEMAPADHADVLYYGSANSHHDVPLSTNSCQSYSFPGKFSASNICQGLDADTLDTSLSLAPVTPGKARGLVCRNSEAKNSTVKNQIVDKGDTQGIELKTPLKKEKRKKHRPKVVKETKPVPVAGKTQTASESSVLREYATSKRKYVTRKGTESDCTGQRDSAKLETAQSHCDDNSTRKRMYVRNKGDGGAESTHLTEVRNNSTIPSTSGYSSRKICRRALSFESEVSIREDEATAITDDSLDLTAACSLFPKWKWTRTELPPLTVLDGAKPSPDQEKDKAGWARSNMSMTEMVLSVQHKFDYFQYVVSMGAATAMAPGTLYGNTYSTGSHYNSNQAHPYWTLSLLNLHEDISVYDGCYSTQENSIQFPRAVGLTGRHSCSVQLEGAMPSITSVWNSSCCTEELADTLQMPRINQKISGVPRVATDDPTYQQHDMIVAYKPAGMIVPYVNTSTPKKCRQRAQVEIDDETNRVWQLLLENSDNDGIDGTDEEKARWWKEERALFQGRADSFITKMRLVQGDRRFSPWKGSVIDSIVGVFLTQNVSDNLSSSAFMSFASSYPIKGSQNSSREEAVASAMSHPNSLIPHENNAETQSRTDNSFTRILNLVNDGIRNGLFMQENNRGIHSYERSPLLFEESKQLDKKDPTGKPNSVEEEKGKFDWDSLRKEAEARRSKPETTPDNLDSVDWESVRHEPVKVISSVIEKRGMHNKLAERIKEFLNRVVRDHGRLDLEWLRDIPPDKAKEYLLSFTGLGPKSVDCVRLLSLHHVAFPVDINVGRVAVRLGWVPLQPLPESLQLHSLEMYPLLESVQRYLWPRLCKLDQGTLYELHYQMITFGKVFCTKTKPNCKACPMRAECRHFASALANTRLGLPAPEQTGRDVAPKENMAALLEPLPFASPAKKLEILDIEDLAGRYRQRICEPIIDEPASPGLECIISVLGSDLEDSIVDFEDDEDIPTIQLRVEEIDRNLQTFSQRGMYIHEDEMSKALVVLPPQAASVPVTPLKSRTRLRTEHVVYEIPQGHPLLYGLDKLEPDDPSQYLLAIWNPGETATSMQPPEGGCSGYASGDGQLCEESSCIRCCSIREANLQIVRGTLLMPCRTAMRGSFPLNGTYFQVNEVFEDHETSLTPLNVPRGLIWNLPRRILYCGATISTILRDMPMEAIRHCFWRGYVCVRGFDRKTRKACPLTDRMHVLASKGDKAKAEAKARAKPKYNGKTK